MSGSFFKTPSFFSTVTPGQLPTYWLEPVRWLKRVVLPQLGLPANAMVVMRHPPLGLGLIGLQSF